MAEAVKWQAWLDCVAYTLPSLQLESSTHSYSVVEGVTCVLKRQSVSL